MSGRSGPAGKAVSPCRKRDDEMNIVSITDATLDGGVPPQGAGAAEYRRARPRDHAAVGDLGRSDVGDRVVVRRIRHQVDAELRYLSRAGIEPGVELEVVEVAPFGLVTVDTSEGEQSLPEEVASLIETAPATEVEA